MPQFTSNDTRDKEFLRDLIEAACLDGSCYEYAFAVSRGTGLPLVGLIADDTIRHVAVVLPDGRFLDARGTFDPADFGRPFGIGPEARQQSVTEEDVRAVRPVSERLENLQRMAQCLHPELPWTGTTFRNRVLAFATELEELSRRHRMWIRGAVPASRPHLADGDDDETGYEVTQTADGVGFTIDRKY